MIEYLCIYQPKSMDKILFKLILNIEISTFFNFVKRKPISLLTHIYDKMYGKLTQKIVSNIK